MKIEKMSEETNKSSFSKYGLYTVNENLELTLPFVLRIPEPEFRVEELGDSSVNIQVLVAS